MVQMLKWLNKALNPFRLSEDYKTLVYKVASGDKDFTSAALREHRKLLQIEEYKATEEYGFMHEIDNPCPDLMQRIRYRKLLLKKNSQSRAI